MNNGWPMVPLGEVLRPLSRAEVVEPTKTYRMLGAHWYALGLYVKETLLGSEIRAPKVYRVEAGDFVYNRLFAWKGSFASATPDVDGCFVSNEFPCFHPAPQRLDGQYLWRFLSRAAAWTEALGLSTGGTPTSRNRLKEEKFLAMRMPLPPLSEQRRIVAKIEQVAAKIEEARQSREHAEADADAVLPSAYSAAYDTASRMAGGVSRLNDLCHRITDGSHRTPTYLPEGVPFLSVKDITTGVIRFDDAKFISPEEHRELIKRCKPERDDVLLTKIGTTGYAKVVDVDREFSIFVSLALLKIDKSRLVPKYLEYMLNSSRLKELSKAGTRGVGNQNLVLKFIRDFPVPVPPLSEQRRIVAHLDGLRAKVDAIKALQAATAAELDALLPSILDRAFKGEL